MAVLDDNFEGLALVFLFLFIITKIQHEVKFDKIAAKIWGCLANIGIQPQTATEQEWLSDPLLRRHTSDYTATYHMRAKKNEHIKQRYFGEACVVLVGTTIASRGLLTASASAAFSYN